MVKLKKILAVSFCLLVVCGRTNAVSAGDSEIIGKFGGWIASRIMEGGHPVCYMSLTVSPPPVKKAKSKRGNIVLMITHRPADNSTDVVSYSAGLKFKPASEAIVTIGSKTFNLFTQGDTAWARDSAADRELAATIRNAETMLVTGVSAQNISLSDTISLKGSFAAYSAISKACGLPVPESPKKKRDSQKAAKAPAKTQKRKPE